MMKKAKFKQKKSVPLVWFTGKARVCFYYPINYLDFGECSEDCSKVVGYKSLAT